MGHLHMQLDLCLLNPVTAILVVSSSKEMLPPLLSIDSAVFVSSSAEESSCVEEQRYLFLSLRSKMNSNTGQVLQW